MNKNKTLKLLTPVFLKKNTCNNVYIELSSKYVGVGVNFALLKENLSGDPHFFIIFSKRLYKSQ